MNPKLTELIDLFRGTIERMNGYYVDEDSTFVFTAESMVIFLHQMSEFEAKEDKVRIAEELRQACQQCKNPQWKFLLTLAVKGYGANQSNPTV